VLSAFLSALAAVYTEWVMKRNSDSLYWQNMQLYSFGVAFNALGLTLANLRQGWPPTSQPLQNLAVISTVAAFRRVLQLSGTTSLQTTAF